MYKSLVSAAKSVWFSGWMLCEDDPEIRCSLFFNDQIRRVASALDLKPTHAAREWFSLIGDDPMALIDPRFPNSVVCVCKNLPARLMRSMPDSAEVFVVSFTKIRSGRPWRADWVVPLDHLGSTGLIVCDIELLEKQFLQVR